MRVEAKRPSVGCAAGRRTGIARVSGVPHRRQKLASTGLMARQRSRGQRGVRKTAGLGRGPTPVARESPRQINLQIVPSSQQKNRNHPTIRMITRKKKLIAR
jgi:hypothetical protein